MASAPPPPTCEAAADLPVAAGTTWIAAVASPLDAGAEAVLVERDTTRGRPVSSRSPSAP